METAEQEREHAKRFFNFLEGGDLEITACYPAGKVGTTQENLLAAAMGEKEEWDTLYAEFAQTASEEGFPAIAATFKNIAKVEAEHERRYLKLLSRLTDGDFFHRDGKIWWQCRNCGYIVEAQDAPKTCPACLFPQAYFEPMKENY
jgi:rubrerythrin